MSKQVTVAAAAAVLLVTGTVWGATRGEGSSTTGSPQTILVSRGDVARTVGGIGHVATLTDASRLAVPSAGTTSTAATSAGGPSLSVEAVYGTVTGHVSVLYVGVGDKVTAGEPIAEISDDGTIRGALIQARSDLATMRLELAQKRVQEPARGLPPTAAEQASARQALVASQRALARLTGRPLPSDLSGARLEIARAVAELESERTAEVARPEALAAAELSVAAAEHRLALLSGAPDPAELAAARLEVAKAQLEQEVLLRAPTAASASEVAAADAAVSAAQQRLGDVQATGTATDVSAAQSELARARADRDALNQSTSAPTAAAQAAAQLAIDAAQRKVDQLLKPRPDLVSAARGELSKARAELVTVRESGSVARRAAARSAVSASQDRLDLLLDPPTELVSSARADVARVAADLAVLRQRGAPASRIDRAIAGLRVDVARQQLALARDRASSLTVKAPASGSVTSVLTATGAAVDSATPLVRVQDLSNLVVSMNLTEFDVSKIRVGSVARVSADALGGRPYLGEVVDVALSGDQTGGVVTFPIIVAIDDPEGLRPGMSVSVRVVVSSRKDVVRLPLDAINERSGRRATVTVRTRSRELRERDVMLGLIGATHAEVVSGLSAGDRIVIVADEET